jgi:SWI/SNF-related matrix-associated actin-dependent regulator 1 of chromatin subfamily A
VRAEYVGDTESVCVAVDAEDRLYVTEHAILTHNTVTAAVCIEKPAVVVCPSLLKVNWVREICKWMPHLTVSMISGSKEPDDPMLKSADVVVVNYDILHHHVGWLAARNNKTLIADEAHYLKTLDVRWNKVSKQHELLKTTTGRAAAFYRLHKDIPRLMLLTGTPILNRTKELWPLLHYLDPQRWGSFFPFGMRYCAGEKTRFGHDFNGRSNMAELREIINGTYMIRHTKEEVLKDLPPKRRSSTLVSLSPDYRKEYNKAVKDFLKWMKEKGGPQAVATAQRAEALVKLTKLRSISAEGKAEAATEMILNFFESTQRPLVVMGVHKGAFQLVKDGFDVANAKYQEAKEKGQMPPICRPVRYGEVVGGQSAKKRQAAIDAFQEEGTLDVLLYSIPIATGTTLTRSQDMYFLERMWRPADQVQAEDREHRIGQTNTVNITYLDAEGTIDGKMGMLLMDKSVTAAGVIDGVDLSTEMAAMLVFGEMTNMKAGFIDSLEEILDDAAALVGEKFDGESLNRNVVGSSLYPIRDLYKDGEWTDGKEDDIQPNRPEGPDELSAMADSSWYDP